MIMKSDSVIEGEVKESTTKSSAEKPSVDHVKDIDAEKKRKAELEEKIRQRVACEERAFRIVQKLVENTVSGDYLKDVAAYIDQSHYDDIVEERSIALVCGYPICDRQLSKVPKQKYRICTKTNTVYDITDSKRYCGTKCYKSSQFYINQVPTSPVWSRKDEQKPQVRLLDTVDSTKHVQGEVVLQDPRVIIKQELEELNRIDSQTTNTDSREKEGLQTENDLPQIFENCSGEIEPNKGHIEVTESTADKAMSCSTLRERLHEPYCHRPLHQQSVGYVNRATYYGYDEKQQELKGELNTEIVGGEIRGKILKIRGDVLTSQGHCRTKEGHCGIGEGQINITTNERTDLNRGLNEGHCGTNEGQYGVGEGHYGVNKGPHGMGQKWNAVDNGVNMNSSVHSYSGVGVTSPLYIDTEGTAQQNVPKADTQGTQMKQSTQSQNKQSTLVKESTQTKLKTQNTESTVESVSTQSKVDRLMDVLDKRDALKKKLHQSADNSGNRCSQINQKSSSSVLVKSSKDKQYSPSKEINQTASNALGKSTMDKSGDSSVKSGDLSNKCKKSSQVLQNIERASWQQKGQVDSDDDDDDDLDEDDIELKSPDNITSQMEQLSVCKSPAVTTARVTPLALIRKVLSEWRTQDTIAYLKGGKAVPDFTDETQQKHAALSRKVEAQIRQYAHLLEDEQNPKPSKPLPSMADLTNDPYSVKVGEFYSAGAKQRKPDKPTYVVEPVDPNANVSRKKKLFDHEVEEDLGYNRSEYITDKDVCLPYVDSQSQTALRRKIVLDKLTRVLTELLGAIHLSVREISSELRALVHTFSLSSENIALKPGEWTLMGYFLLKMLSHKMKSLRKSLKQENSVHFFSSVLQSFGVTISEVNETVDFILTR